MTGEHEAPGDFGALAPGRFDRAVIRLTRRLPHNKLGKRLAVLLRRIVTMRLPAGALDVELWGTRMRLHPLDNGHEKIILFTPQMYDPIELPLLAAEVDRVLAAGRPFVFVDVGANVGQYSLFVAGRARGRARVLAIEPEAGNFARLAFNAAANPSLGIQPVRVALGDHDGEVAIALDTRNRVLTRSWPVEQAPSGAARVPCRLLADVLTEHGIEAIDALKIDVEGAEYAILAPLFRDAPRALWPRLIAIEDSSHLWPGDLFALLTERGYRIEGGSRKNVFLRLADPH
jgi:FkbM family methyltransferase